MAVKRDNGHKRAVSPAALVIIVVAAVIGAAAGSVVPIEQTWFFLCAILGIFAVVAAGAMALIR